MLPLDPTWSCGGWSQDIVSNSREGSPGLPDRNFTTDSSKSESRYMIDIRIELSDFGILWHTLAYFGITLAYFDCMLAWQF